MVHRQSHRRSHSRIYVQRYSQYRKQQHRCLFFFMWLQMQHACANETRMHVDIHKHSRRGTLDEYHGWSEVASLWRPRRYSLAITTILHAANVLMNQHVHDISSVEKGQCFCRNIYLQHKTRILLYNTHQWGKKNVHEEIQYITSSLILFFKRLQVLMQLLYCFVCSAPISTVFCAHFRAVIFALSIQQVILNLELQSAMKHFNNCLQKQKLSKKRKRH